MRAYQKGLAAERSGKLPDASKDFAKAVEIYPKYVYAWFQLGLVLQKQHLNDQARDAFRQAANLDPKFLLPFMELASLAFAEKNWPEVLKFTGHILELDPVNQTNVTGYILDLDPLNCSEAYFYDAVAHYELHQIDQAEKSALKAKHVDLLTRFPQLHVLLAEIFAQKQNYPEAIDELQTYLALVPTASEADYLRQKLAKLEKLNDGTAAGDKVQQ